MEARSAYAADRAAALAGVPRSTVHYWARTGLLVPRVSSERTKLWSYEDIAGLRVIDWLRHSKVGPKGEEIPATHMRAIRRALKALQRLKQDVWTESDGPRVLVDRGGRLFVKHRDAVAEPLTASGSLQVVEADLLDLLAPFGGTATMVGPDLRVPRPHLRIIPGKLAGSPHVTGTRVETAALGALAERGMDTSLIRELYPTLPPVAIDEAIDLESQLSRNLAAA